MRLQRILYFLIFLVLISGKKIAAQTVQLNIFVNPFASAELAKWNQNPGQFQLAAINTQPMAQDVKLNFTIRDNGGNILAATSDFNTLPVIKLQPGPNSINTSLVFNTDLLTFSGEFEKSVNKTGNFPEGEFVLCATALSPANGNVLSTGDACGYFLIEKLQSPLLIFPFDGYQACGPELSNLVFQWTPISREYSFTQVYQHFVLTELYPGQTALEALVSNMPLVEEFIPYNQNQWRWPENLIPAGDSQNYVWGVNLYDDRHVMISDYNFPFTTVCRRRDSTIVRPDTFLNPGTTVTHTPTTTTRDACASPGYKLLKGSEVTVGMTVDQPAEFPYPRAVPIRADGKDKDVVTILCSGCRGGISETPIVIREDVGDFTWELLSDLGSLNSPLDQKMIDSLAAEIAALLKRLQDVNDSIEIVNKAIDPGLQKKKELLEKKIENLKKEIAETEKEKDKLQKTSDSLSKAISEKQNIIAQTESQINQKKSEIKKLLSRIDSLQKVLKGGPGKDEQELLKRIGQKRESADMARQNLELLENQWQNTLSDLQKKVIAANAELEKAVTKYNQAKDNLEALALQIIAIRNKINSTPDGKILMENLDDWKAKYSEFSTRYDSKKEIKKEFDNTTDKGLQALSYTTPALRAQGYSAFASDLKLVLARARLLCKDNPSCSYALDEVNHTATGFEAIMQDLINKGYVLDYKLLKKMDTLRRNISGGEAGLQPYQKAVTEANEKLNKAQKNYFSELEKTENERQTELNKIETMEEEASEMESQLKQLSDTRLEDEDKKRQGRIEELSAKKSELSELESEVIVLGDSLFTMKAALEELKGKKVQIAEKIAETVERIKLLNEEIGKTEKAIDNLKTEKTQLEKKLKSLEKEKKEIEEKLAALKSRKAEKSKGNKTASGPVVYYIPPPLEDIIKNQKLFSDLKDSVAKAEAELQLAYAAKGKVQGKLAAEVEKIASNLMKIKAAEKVIKSTEEELTELENDLAKDKTRKYQEYLKKQQEAQKAQTEAEKEKTEADKSEKEAEQDKEDKETELEDKKKELDEIKKALEEFEKQYKERQNELKKEEEILSGARNTLQGYIAERESLQTEILQLQSDLGKQKNDLTRAYATEQDKEVSEKIKSEISQTESKLKLSRETKLPGLNEKINSAGNSVKSAILRVAEVRRQDSLAMLEWKKKLEELKEKATEVIESNEEFEKAVTELDEKKKESKEAEESLEKAEKEREELQDDIEKQVNEDEDIAEKTKEKEKLEKTKDKAEKDKTTAENAIAESLNISGKWKEAADAKVNSAKEKLEKAEKELREFLLREFKEVNFSVNIKLKGKDKVADFWRSADGTGENTAQLTYPSNRVPQFNGQPAEDKSPSEPTILNRCIPEYVFKNPPAATVTPPLEGREPRTIALIYKEGKPLWPEWPVLKNDGKLLAKDVVPVAGGGTDNDMFQRSCISQAEFKCPPGGPVVDMIKDLGTFNWESKDGIVLGYNALHPWMLWKTNSVDKPLVEKPQEVKIKFLAADFAPDEEMKEKGLPLVRAGVLLECSKDTTGIPEKVYTMQGRVVNGEHKGLPQEEIEFEVVLKKGEAKEYGFDGSQLKVTKMSDGNGYGRADFNFGKGYAEFEISIRWKRGGKVVEEEKLKAVSPLLLRLYRFSAGAPVFAWDAALKVLNGDMETEAALASFPEKSDKNDKGKTTTLRGVAGLMNAEFDFVNDEWTEYSASGGKKADAARDKTKIYGLSRTQVAGIKDKESVTLTVQPETKYKPVSRPEKESKTFNGAKQKKFKIGIPSNPFIIVMDEEFDPNEEISGTGMLGAEVAGNEVLQYFKKVSLEIDGVTVEGEESDLMATAGAVKWDPGSAADFSWLGVEFKFSSLGILAQKGATLKGSAKPADVPDPVEFEAEFDADGNFLGTVSNIPEIEIKKFKLKKGAEFSIDFHDEKSPGTLEATFKGLLIHSATLEFPELFNGPDDTKTELEVTDFYVGSRYVSGGSRSMGFGGKAALKGAFFKMGYAKYEFVVQELSLEFENSSLKSGGFSGELSMPIPFDGKVTTEVEISGDGFTAEVSTERPVTLPRLGLSMTFLKGSGIEYNSKEKIGKLSINAFMVTKGLGEVEIKEFEVSSDGTIKATEITLEKSIKFGSGFDLHAKSIAFSRTSEEISLSVKGGFSFPKIGIDNLMGVVSVSSVHGIEVKLTGGKISFDYNPVTFMGEFSYSGREFKGKFDIGIKKVLPQGIQGVFIVGNVETENAPSWNYWYAELSVGTKIPLGQTGLMVLGLGGGLGYNYIPPIGSTEGHPQQNDAFSFKAILQMGTAPGGELFAGRMEMVLVPGKFSLYGKCWLLTQKESIYGEGQLDLQWAPTAELNGFLAMYIGLPDSKGGLFQAQGKVNFHFAGSNDFYIRTEEVKASVMQAVRAEASFDLNKQFLELKGRIYYKLDKSLPLAVVTVKASLDLNADGKLNYAWKKQTLSSKATFTGKWDVDLETPMGTADITNGDINLSAEFNASPGSLEIKASAKISYDVWFYKDSIEMDFGYKSAA